VYDDQREFYDELSPTTPRKAADSFEAHGRSHRATVVRELVKSLRLEIAVIISELSTRPTPPFRPLIIAIMSSMYERLVQVGREALAVARSVVERTVSTDEAGDFFGYFGKAVTCYKLIQLATENPDRERTNRTITALEIAGRSFEERLAASMNQATNASGVGVSVFSAGPSDHDSFRRAVKELVPGSILRVPFRKLDQLGNRLYTDEVPIEDDIERLIVTARIPTNAREAFALTIKQLIDDTLNAGVTARSAEVESTSKRKSVATVSLPTKGDVIRYDQRHKHKKLRDLGIIDFLIQVWGPSMEARVLTRTKLRELDPSADKALQNWLSHRPRRALPSEIYLPTKKEVHDEILARDPKAVLRSPKLARTVAERLRRGAPKKATQGG